MSKSKKELEADYRKLARDFETGRKQYYLTLAELVPYMRGELEHLRRENAELRNRTEGDEHG